MAEKSKVLVIGATGYIGKFIVEASTKLDHPTFALVREGSSISLEKQKLLQSFESSGVTLLYGDVGHHKSLVKAIKQVDVVISTVGPYSLLEQINIIDAIKEAGNVKRFVPSEFGSDVDRTRAVDPAKFVFGNKSQIRRRIEAEGIPYIYVCNDFFSGCFLPSLVQVEDTKAPPRDRVVILAVFNKEEDIATYLIKAVDDPRTLNKTFYVKPPNNMYSINDLVLLWEKKIRKTLERVYLTEEQSPWEERSAAAAVKARGGGFRDSSGVASKIKERRDLPPAAGDPLRRRVEATEGGGGRGRGGELVLPSTLSMGEDELPPLTRWEEKSKILIIGGTGYIGKYIVEASVKLGHPTSILLRESTVSAKDKLIECFGNSEVAVLHGDLCNHERLLSAIKQVDMAISVVGDLSLLKDQITITAAIKETGNVKKKIGETLERIYIPEEQVLKNVEEGSFLDKKHYSMGHSIFVKEDQTHFEIKPSFGAEASEMHLEVKYTTVDEYLNQFA
ncbi:hypothetical protein Sjap_010323 [Stephania japonica]|uniref:NmrA-like domain-containing protein n=1 Tax=Stephania japonica TaxID=461633 RepID=A0AAP0P710_9MAGN